MKLHIKNMVCDRCIMMVESELKKLGLHPVSVTLGVAEISESHLSDTKLKTVDQQLTSLGFERIEDHKKQMIEQVKALIIKKIHHNTLQQGFNWSSHISQNVYHDYRYLSQLFSAMESLTIEQYIIRQKIEKVKELIVYDQLNFTEIAYQLGYSSPAHMSNQFKKITGMTPGHFKKLRKPIRTPIDKVK
jgi:AraC-like DNA-binding protein